MNDEIIICVCCEKEAVFSFKHPVNPEAQIGIALCGDHVSTYGRIMKHLELWDPRHLELMP